MGRAHTFHKVQIGNTRFHGFICGHGIFLRHDRTYSDAPINPDASIAFVEGEVLQSPAWHVMKHHGERRISLSGLPENAVQKLADEFGLPVRRDAMSAGMSPVVFFSSPAGRALREWADKHPVLARRWGVTENRWRWHEAMQAFEATQ